MMGSIIYMPMFEVSCFQWGSVIIFVSCITCICPLYYMFLYTVGFAGALKIKLLLLWAMVVVLRSQCPGVENDDIVHRILLFLNSTATHLMQIATFIEQESMLSSTHIV
jgi:hypothetical protein